jgi:hypothetical protein
MSENTCCPGACSGCGGSLGRSYHWTLNATYCQRCYRGIAATQRQAHRERFDRVVGEHVQVGEAFNQHELAQPQGACNGT